MTAADAEPPRRPAGWRRHAAHRFLGRLHEVLDALSTDALWALTPRELGECLEEVFAGQARLAALALALELVAQADRSDLPTHDAQPTMVSWLRERVRVAPAEGKRLVRLARALEDHPLTGQALEAGAFPVASAAVIVDAVEALPADLDPGLREKAETYLAGEAHAHDTRALRRLADHLEEVVNPDGADARLAEQLARAEAKAARETFLVLHYDDVNQVTDGVFRLPLLAGVKLQRMVEALTNPGRPDPIPLDEPETGVRLSAEARRGLAFAELLDRFPVGRLPKLGGSDLTVVVTMSLETLTGGLRAAQLDTGHAISPGLGRRLAARTGVIPAVLGSSDEVLNLGRKARLYKKKQRLAMLVQQHGTCAVHDCQRPAFGGDAHHLIPWSNGGRTDVADGVLICPRHHTLADHPDYRVTRLRPGRIQIHRRC